MATASPTQSTPKPARQTKVTARVDYASIRRSVAQLLDSRLNEYQKKLNSHLIAELQSEFDLWLEQTRKEIAAQLKNVPVHAREKWLAERLATNDRRRAENQPIRLLTDFLFQYANQKLEQLKSLKAGNQVFRKTFANLRSAKEKEKLILNYAAELGATRFQLKGDERALERWFDEEAVTDRFARQVGKIELIMAFTYDRISELIDIVFRLAHSYHDDEVKAHQGVAPFPIEARLTGIWKRINIESRVHDALVYDGDDRVHVAVLKCLCKALSRMPDGLGIEILDPRTLLFIRRAAMESNSDVWIQCEALTIIKHLSFEQALPILTRRLESPAGGDDIFVRRHAAKLLLQHMQQNAGSECRFELPSIKSEPSPFVRQIFAKVAFVSSNETSDEVYEQLALGDECHQVRAAAILVGAEVQCTLQKLVYYLQVLESCLENETNSFVLRVAFFAANRVLERLETSEPNQEQLDSIRRTVHDFFRDRIVPKVRRLQTTHQETQLRRWAAQSNEQTWAWLDVTARELVARLRPIISSVQPGGSCRVPKSLFENVAAQKLGRIFAVLSQDDFGFDITKGWLSYKITRGPTFGFRLWRFIYEFTNTATDKRQALRHTVGRISTATMRAPSQILGELSETKVPGEPLTIGDDGTWRPFMPLLDDFVSILNLSWLKPRTVSFYSSQGITRVTGPKGICKRISAAFQLNWNFSRFAEKRNWDGDTFRPNEYLESLRKIGFEIEFTEYNVDEEIAEQGDSDSSCAADESVTRFFSLAGIGIPLLGVSFFDSAAWKQFLKFSDYFSSAFENSIEELLVFAVLLTLFVLCRHFYANYSFRKARRKIPLSIGGWGTRGKSGTERLKAALIGVMGHGLVSKTTGCEAMFIHADAYGEPLEIPLFRPYDKATIWEQRNLIMMASKMDPSVFLWECMALTPAFVDVLQRQWTCDDLGTITNTYPDHEDLQGPAGYNVAETISGFVPLNSHLISTEQMMRPYVIESCKRANSSFRGVGWLESGLITDDVLERFPYKEHPDNVALVAAMGDELGCQYEFCLKAMADYLVPDLGVLKTHPESIVRTRKIEFTNGMSANERFGCMGNWRRLGYDQQDPWTEPTTWVSGIVNNRADRVPRSKVFAKIIVDDVNADRFFLIGNNLKGLLGFISDAWEEKSATLSLRDQGQPWDKEFALKTLKQAAWNYRQPITIEHIRQKLGCMISAVKTNRPINSKIDIQIDETLCDDPGALKSAMEKSDATPALVESIAKHHTELLQSLREYQELKRMINEASTNNLEPTEKRFVEVLGMWFKRKLVVIENYDATGEDVVAALVDETPPGFRNRAMGLQNIKGTGLDFVYRFQAWDVCHEACHAALDTHPQTAERGLQTLLSMPVIGQLCHNRIAEVIESGRSSRGLARTDMQVLLEQLEQKLELATKDDESFVKAASADSTNTRNQNRAELNAWLIESTEQFLDVHDSIRRRDQADLIYKDLAAQRISRQRAVLELRKLNKRQKGGWFAAKFAK